MVPEQDGRDKGIRHLAGSYAQAMLAAISSSSLYVTLMAAITTALTAAAGEGYASALAVAASKAGKTGFDWHVGAAGRRAAAG